LKVELDVPGEWRTEARPLPLPTPARRGRHAPPQGRLSSHRKPQPL